MIFTANNLNFLNIFGVLTKKLNFDFLEGILFLKMGMSKNLSCNLNNSKMYYERKIKKLGKQECKSCTVYLDGWMVHKFSSKLRIEVEPRPEVREVKPRCAWK